MCKLEHLKPLYPPLTNLLWLSWEVKDLHCRLLKFISIFSRNLSFYMFYNPSVFTLQGKMLPILETSYYEDW